MSTYGISNRSYERILKVLGQFPEINEVKIFGSRAKGNYNTGSDIDLAISGENISGKLIFKINSLLNQRLSIPYKIDVVDYGNLSHTKLKDHIRRRGKVFYLKNDSKSTPTPKARIFEIQKQD